MTSRGSVFKSFFWYLSDTWELVNCNLRHISRDLDQISGLIVMPVIYTVLFRYLFGGAIGSDVPGEYIDYLIPGMLVMNILFVSIITCVSISNDLKKGIINRFRSMPISQSAVINGHIIAGLLRCAFIIAVVIGLGFAMGFDPVATPAQWMQAIGILLLVALATSCLLMFVGLVAKGVESAQQFGNILILSLAMMSSALIPPVTLPKYLRMLVENQPYTRAMEAMRALLVDAPADSHVYATLIWFSSIVLVMFVLDAVLFSRVK